MWVEADDVVRWRQEDERWRDGEDYKEREMAMEMVLWLEGGGWISRLCAVPVKRGRGACTEPGASVWYCAHAPPRPHAPRPRAVCQGKSKTPNSWPCRK